MSFINQMEKMLALFISVHGRKPNNGEEFSNWCEHYENNTSSLNSRRDVLHEADDDELGHLRSLDSSELSEDEKLMLGYIEY